MLIGLNGPPRIGKTFTADYLVENYGFRKLNLAQGFKSFIAESLDVSLQTLEEIKDHAFQPDNSHISTIASPTIRNMLEPDNTKVRDLFIEAANLIERVDASAWIRRSLKDIDIRNNCYVLDSVGKIAQWAYVVHHYEWGEHCLWRLYNKDRGLGWNLFSDGRQGINKFTFNKKIDFCALENEPFSNKWKMDGELEDQIAQEMVRLGVAH